MIFEYQEGMMHGFLLGEIRDFSDAIGYSGSEACLSRD